MKSFLIFDFDGVICDSFELTVNLAQKLVDSKDEEFDVGRTLKEEGFGGFGLPKEKVFLLLEQLREGLSKNLHILTPYDQVKETLETISPKFRMGIVSANSKSMIEQFLEKHELENHFEFVHADMGPSEKAPVLAKIMETHKATNDDFWYIGDSPQDIKAAKKVNMKSIAAGWGFSSKALLEAENADLFLEQIAALKEML